MSKLKWVAAAAIAAVVLVVGGTWIYINVIREDAPPPLELSPDDGPDASGDDTDTDDGEAGADGEPDDAAPGDSGPIAGTWVPTSDSIVGYRVGEVLFGQTTEAVGRTSDVTGEVVVDATTVTAASFTVDMTTVSSDESRRDGQFRGRVMDVANHPTATLVLVDPIVLDGDGSVGSTFSGDVTAELTLRGVTKTVTMALEAQRLGDRIEVAGSLPVVFEEWGIPNPSMPGIETEDEGLLEVLLVLARA